VFFNNREYMEKVASGLDQESIDSELDLFARYKGSPQVVDFITEINYPDFIYHVHYLEGNEDDEKEIWKIRKIGTTRYRLIFNVHPDTKSTVELNYDPEEGIFRSGAMKYKKR